jgi:hypothetical protein
MRNFAYFLSMIYCVGKGFWQELHGNLEWRWHFIAALILIGLMEVAAINEKLNKKK